MAEETRILTPIKAIRAKCLDCMCGQTQEVRLCPITDCPLFPYRMGHNPNKAGKGGKPPIQVRKKEQEAEEERWYTALDDDKIPCGEEGCRE